MRKDRTNAALQRSNRNIEIPTTFDVAGVTYDMNTRQPVNQSQPNPRRSRYSSGNAGGAGQYSPDEVFSPPSDGNTNRSNRRGSGAKGRTGNIDFGALKPKPSIGRGARYSSGAAAASVVDGAGNGSSVLPSLQPGDDIDKKDYPAGITPGGSEGGGGGDDGGGGGDDGGGGGGGGGGNGRGQIRTSPTGVIQTGTQTGLKPMTMDDANALLSPGFSVQNPYDSTQLPTTGASLYTKDPSTVTFETGGTEGINSGQSTQRLTKDLFAAGGAVEFTESTPGMPTSTAIEATQTEGGANLVQSGESGTTDWLNRSMADNSDQNLARRRAFLDAESSLQGLRDAESTQGIVYAGGQHHMLNPNRGQEGQNDFVTIDSKDDVRGYKSGRLSAQDMRDKYVKKIVDSGTTTYDADKVSETAGPLADNDAYGTHLKSQQDKYKMTGKGPVADADEYGEYLKSR